MEHKSSCKAGLNEGGHQDIQEQACWLGRRLFNREPMHTLRYLFIYL